MMTQEKPDDFNPKFSIVSCFFEYQGKLLLLHRQDSKPQANTWGVPAGKMEDGESADEAMLRELAEETGYVASHYPPILKCTVYVRYSEYDFTYHIYHLTLVESHTVRINQRSHKNFRWVTPAEALKMDLIQDLDACIELFYQDKIESL